MFLSLLTFGFRGNSVRDDLMSSEVAAMITRCVGWPYQARSLLTTTLREECDSMGSISCIYKLATCLYPFCYF